MIDQAYLNDGGINNYYLRSLYSQTSFVYPIVNRIAQKIAAQPLIVVRKKNVNGKVISEPIGHSALKIIKHPNPVQNYYHFNVHVISELILMGNSVVLAFNNLLVPYPWENVTPVYNKDGLKYRVSGHHIGDKHTYEFTSDNVIHIRMAGLGTLYEGMSPFSPGKSDLEFMGLSQDFLTSAFKDGANPDLVVSTDKDSDTNVNALSDFIDKLYASNFGAANKRKPLALPKGVSAKRLQQSLADPELRHYRHESKLNILALLNMPPHELGIQEAGSLGSEETKNATKNFWESTLIPVQKLVSEALSIHFFGYESDLCFEYNNDGVECLQKDKLRNAEIAKIASAFFTTDEIRDRYFQAGPAPKSLQEERLPTNVKDKSYLTKGPETRTAIKAGWVQGRLKLENRLYEKSYNKVHKSVSDWLSSFIVRAFNNFDETISKRTKAIDDDDFLDIFEHQLNDLESQALDEIKNTFGIFSEISEISYDLFLKSPLLPNSPAIQRIKDRKSNGRRAVLEARKLESFAGITETTTEMILEDITKGMKQSETIQQISRRVREYQLKEIIPRRAETIARTEVLGAVSHGQSIAADDAEKELEIELEKTWIAAGDKRCRQSHKALDGEKKPKKEAFSNGLMYPRDPKGSAKETINCRCTWLVFPKGENFT